MALTNPSVDPQTVQVVWTIMNGLATLFIGWLALELNRRNAINAERATANAEAKLRLDLFERRFAIYDEVKKFLSLVRRNKSLTEEQLEAFHTNVREADFLFDADVSDFIRKMRDDADELEMAVLDLREIDAGEADEEGRTNAIDRKRRNMKSLSDRSKQAKDVFLPYLDFRELRSGKQAGR